MFSCLLIALAFAAPWSINTISPMTSATLFSKAFPGDGCFVGELEGMSLANVDLELSFPPSLTLLVYIYIIYLSMYPNYVYSNTQYLSIYSM